MEEDQTNNTFISSSSGSGGFWTTRIQRRLLTLCAKCKQQSHLEQLALTAGFDDKFLQIDTGTQGEKFLHYLDACSLVLLAPFRAGFEPVYPAWEASTLTRMLKPL